jgi:ATP-dependent protease HslVU (ClpYQ) peptidase subunit
MNIIEKAEQLREQAQRLQLDEAAAGILAGAFALLEEMAQKVTSLTDELASLTEQVDDLDDALEELCEDVYGEDEDEVFEVECPNCGELIQIDEGILEDGSIICPGCDEKLEFEFGCDCDECHDEGCPEHKHD